MEITQLVEEFLNECSCFIFVVDVLFSFADFFVDYYDENKMLSNYRCST